jgi:hypothetical protein
MDSTFLGTRGFTLALAVFGAWIFIISSIYVYSPTGANKTSGLFHTAEPARKAEIYNCQDPYRRSGYLYTNQSDYRQTRWIPYTKDFFEAFPLDIAVHPASADFDLEFDPQYFEPEVLGLPSTPKSWMSAVVAENARRRAAITPELLAQNDSRHFLEEKDGGDFGWLWGRRLLIAGDSVDRLMINYFCNELDGQWQQTWHVSGVCEVPAFNLTMVHWHIISMLNYKPHWFEEQKMPTAFEDRWDGLWAETREKHVRGLNGKGPDLILWQSGLWDQTKLFFDLQKSHYGAATDDKKIYQNTSDPSAVFHTNRRQAVWHELRFMSTRLQKLVSYLHETFGTHTPIMYRSLTYHIGGMYHYDYMLMELNRLGRAVAENAGHEVFEWGRIVNGFSAQYIDDQHMAKGPASWLWGNMFLEYMARSAGLGDEQRQPYFDSWSACHDNLVDWGGA